MDANERARLISIYGACRVCGEPRKQKIVETGDSLTYSLVCSADETHRMFDPEVEAALRPNLTLPRGVEARPGDTPV